MRWNNLCGRLLALVPVLLAITFVTFGLLRLAGGDVITQKMENTGQVLSPEVVAEARRELGLDKPFLVQYARWLGGILEGDMGKSYVSGLDVFDTFVSKLPATLLLAGAAVGLTAAISIPLGTLAAMRRGGAVDWAVRLLSLVGNPPGYSCLYACVALNPLRVVGVGLERYKRRHDVVEGVVGSIGTLV